MSVPTDAEIDAMWLTVLPAPPKPLSEQTEEDIRDWMWRCVAAADSACVEGRTQNGIAALEWIYKPTNWPFGPTQRSRCQHIYGGLHRRLLEEAQWKRDTEGAERAKAAAKQAHDLRRERGWV